MPELRVIEAGELERLLRALGEAGYRTVAPVREQGAIAYQEVDGLSRLPRGYEDSQDGGYYRLHKRPAGQGKERALFAYTVGPNAWKRFLFPPRQRLWSAARTDDGAFTVFCDAVEAPKYAFVGVRACEIAAFEIQDRVLLQGPFIDKAYRARREAAFLIAVDCQRVSATCFCASMGTGPAPSGGYDLRLSELVDEDRHLFVVRSGSDAGEDALSWLVSRPAQDREAKEVEDVTARAASAMVRRMPSEAAEVLRRNAEHPRWEQVAARCLGCANCTLVCPTCFCTTVEDSSSLNGTEAERWRRWDSCFSIELSYIHGGAIRYNGAARYRQWITHKLSTWYAQFGTSGCTGCGRCITWCPVGIDITEEVAELQAAER